MSQLATLSRMSEVDRRGDKGAQRCGLLDQILETTQPLFPVMMVGSGLSRLSWQNFSVRSVPLKAGLQWTLLQVVLVVCCRRFQEGVLKHSRQARQCVCEVSRLAIRTLPEETELGKWLRRWVVHPTIGFTKVAGISYPRRERIPFGAAAAARSPPIMGRLCFPRIPLLRIFVLADTTRNPLSHRRDSAAQFPIEGFDHFATCGVRKPRRTFIVNAPQSPDFFISIRRVRRVWFSS